jgi:hypothetical protein
MGHGDLWMSPKKPAAWRKRWKVRAVQSPNANFMEALTPAANAWPILLSLFSLCTYPLAIGRLLFFLQYPLALACICAAQQH